MGPVTEKALRPRVYVFDGVAREKRGEFARRIRDIRLAEQLEEQKAREGAAERARHAARGHAVETIRRSEEAEKAVEEKIKSAAEQRENESLNKSQPQDPNAIRILELNDELEMLLAERTRLYDLLAAAVKDRRRQALGLTGKPTNGVIEIQPPVNLQDAPFDIGATSTSTPDGGAKCDKETGHSPTASSEAKCSQ